MSKHGASGRCPAWASVSVLLAFTHPAAGFAATAPDGLAIVPPRDAAVPSRDTDCLAEAVFYEAGGEARTGREAVAEVVMNRLHDPAYPKTVCGVVFQGSTRATGCQFTFACDGARINRRPTADAWAEAEAIAADALAGRLASSVGASTHYHATWMRPYWSYAMTPTARIGGHQFYVAGGGRTAPRLVMAAAAAAPAPQATAFSVWGLQVAVVAPTADGAASVSAR